MDPTEQDSLKTGEFDQIMAKIERHCNPDSGEGVAFYQSSELNDSEEKTRRIAANTVYDGMMLTLNNIAEHSLTKAKDRRHPLAKNYETVLRALEPLTQISRAIADGKLPLRRNFRYEEILSKVGDKIHAYKLRQFKFDTTEYDEVEVIIRPEKWEEPLDIRKSPNRLTLTGGKESAQPKMQINIKPKNFPYGFITIRVDREDLEHDFEITYDVEIGYPGQVNIINMLDFPDADQRHTHHFSSALTAEELGTSFKDILEAINDKISSNIPN